jgi:hypothetical protein
VRLAVFEAERLAVKLGEALLLAVKLQVFINQN